MVDAHGATQQVIVILNFEFHDSLIVRRLTRHVTRWCCMPPIADRYGGDCLASMRILHAYRAQKKPTPFRMPAFTRLV
jgi:hypothetical protein